MVLAWLGRGAELSCIVVDRVWVTTYVLVCGCRYLAPRVGDLVVGHKGDDPCGGKGSKDGVLPDCDEFVHIGGDVDHWGGYLFCN